MYKIAIIEPIHEDGVKLIENQNDFSYELITNTDENFLIDKLKDFDAIALRTAKLSAKIINNCKKLKIVSRHGVGYDNVDLTTLSTNKILLTITINANAITVSEHVISMMFYLNKKIHLFNESVKENNFDKLRIANNNIITINSELYEKNLLIAGFGRIGRELAKRCKSFGMQVFVYDPYVNENTLLDCGVKQIKSLNQALSIADYTSIHMPLNKETKNLINKEHFKIMKKNSFIINTARGGIINEVDLNDALEKKLIAGAGLDVFENEPPESDNLLLKNPSIVLTPHTAALTKECWSRMGRETIINIINYFNGKLNQQTVVNKEVLN